MWKVFMINCKVYWKHMRTGRFIVSGQDFEDEEDIRKYIKRTMRWTLFRVMVLIGEKQ